jgi:hypothetical protein
MVKEENVSQYDEDDEFLSFSNHSHFVLGVISNPKKDLVYENNYSMLEKCISTQLLK